MGAHAHNICAQRGIDIIGCAELHTSGVHARLASNRSVDIGLRGAHHAAIGVGHDQDAVDAEEVGAEEKCAQDIIGHTCAGVAQDLDVPRVHPECRQRVDARVNAGDHGESSRRTAAQCAAGVGSGVCGVGREHIKKRLVGETLGIRHRVVYLPGHGRGVPRAVTVPGSDRAGAPRSRPD